MESLHRSCLQAFTNVVPLVNTMIFLSLGNTTWETPFLRLDAMVECGWLPSHCSIRGGHITEDCDWLGRSTWPKVANESLPWDFFWHSVSHPASIRKKYENKASVENREENSVSLPGSGLIWTFWLHKLVNCIFCLSQFLLSFYYLQLIQWLCGWIPAHYPCRPLWNLPSLCLNLPIKAHTGLCTDLFAHHPCKLRELCFLLTSPVPTIWAGI